VATQFLATFRGCLPFSPLMEFLHFLFRSYGPIWLSRNRQGRPPPPFCEVRSDSFAGGVGDPHRRFFFPPRHPLLSPTKNPLCWSPSPRFLGCSTFLFGITATLCPNLENRVFPGFCNVSFPGCSQPSGVFPLAAPST